MLRFLLFAMALSLPARAGELAQTVGRTQIVLRSAPHPLVAGRTLDEQAVPERLARLGYRAVAQRPTEPGTYQQTTEALWIYRRAHRANGRRRKARPIGFALSDGVVTGGLRVSGGSVSLDRGGHWLEPEVLTTALSEERAPIVPVDLDDLPEAAWRPLLALEDHRFFQHAGISARAIGRALRANRRSGGAVQGGSTITQQLVKNRDLTPRRGLDRKASEAVRALVVEARYDKRSILQAYLNTVYYGHHRGVGLYGIEQAAQTWFSKPATELDLAEGAALAALVQAPSALHPLRNADALRERQARALDQIEALGWAEPAEVRAARTRGLPLNVAAPPHPVATSHVRAAARVQAEAQAGRRMRRDLGLQIETTLDPWLQAQALAHTTAALRRLRADYAALRDAPLHAAVAVMDAHSGELRAYIGGDPADHGDSFDRADRALRQPGSTLKPLILLHAYADCEGGVVRPSTQISDAPMTLDGWSPRNADGKMHGHPSARTALIRSFNRPFVRLTEHCGREEAAALLRDAGLSVPEPAPASLALGPIEQRPLDLLAAHSVFPADGRRVEPRLITRLARPNGTRTGGEGRDRTRVARAAPTWLVTEALRAVVAQGTGRAAQVAGHHAAGKTGTSSDSRDAWFVGHIGDTVAVVWVGLDRGTLGLSGSAAAAPLWAKIMADAADLSAPIADDGPPRGVVACRVNPKTGLAPGVLGDSDAEDGWCLRRNRPKRNQPWRSDSADRVR